MENTTQSKSYFPLGILLLPLLLPFMGGFFLYSWRNRKNYRGAEEYPPRYLFFRRLYGVISQLNREINVLRMGDYLSRRNKLVVVYCSKLSWGMLSFCFLLSVAYRNVYQRMRIFKLCVLSDSNPGWLFLLSSLEILRKVPSPKFLRESNYSLICFSDSLEEIKKIVLNSYKTVVLFRCDSLSSGKRGVFRVFEAIGELNLREKVGNNAQIELKLDKLLSLLK